MGTNDGQSGPHGEPRRLGLGTDGLASAALAAHAAVPVAAGGLGGGGAESFFRRRGGGDPRRAGAVRAIAAVGPSVARGEAAGGQFASAAGVRGVRFGIQLLARGHRRERGDAGFAGAGGADMAAAGISPERALDLVEGGGFWLGFGHGRELGAAAHAAPVYRRHFLAAQTALFPAAIPAAAGGLGRGGLRVLFSAAADQ